MTTDEIIKLLKEARGRIMDNYEAEDQPLLDKLIELETLIIAHWG